MERTIKDIERDLQRGYVDLANNKINESILQKLTCQVIITLNKGEISDVRLNNIITGATQVSYFTSTI